MALVVACTVDHTNDVQLSGLVHQCFSTVKESILYQTACPPVGPWRERNMAGWACDTVTYVDEFPFPLTLQSYQEDPQHVAGRIREVMTASDVRPGKVTVLGGLAAGISFEITQMYRWTNGENGTFWLAIASVRDGEYKGIRILLPWDGSPRSYTKGPWMIQPKLATSPLRRSKYPEFDPKYMTRCGDNAGKSSPTS